MKALKRFFIPQPVTTQARDELHQAEKDLLEAEHNHEHWEYRAQMLRERCERLRGIISVPTQ